MATDTIHSAFGAPQNKIRVYFPHLYAVKKHKDQGGVDRETSENAAKTSSSGRWGPLVAAGLGKSSWAVEACDRPEAGKWGQRGLLALAVSGHWPGCVNSCPTCPEHLMAAKSPFSPEGRPDPERLQLAPRFPPEGP